MVFAYSEKNQTMAQRVVELLGSSEFIVDMGKKGKGRGSWYVNTAGCEYAQDRIEWYSRVERIFCGSLGRTNISEQSHFVVKCRYWLRYGRELPVIGIRELEAQVGIEVVDWLSDMSQTRNRFYVDKRRIMNDGIVPTGADSIRDSWVEGVYGETVIEFKSLMEYISLDLPDYCEIDHMPEKPQFALWRPLLFTKHYCIASDIEGRYEALRALKTASERYKWAIGGEWKGYSRIEGFLGRDLLPLPLYGDVSCIHIGVSTAGYRLDCGDVRDKMVEEIENWAMWRRHIYLGNFSAYCHEDVIIPGTYYYVMRDGGTGGAYNKPRLVDVARKKQILRSGLYAFAEDFNTIEYLHWLVYGYRIPTVRVPAFFEKSGCDVWNDDLSKFERFHGGLNEDWAFSDFQNPWSKTPSYWSKMKGFSPRNRMKNRDY